MGPYPLSLPGARWLQGPKDATPDPGALTCPRLHVNRAKSTSEAKPTSCPHLLILVVNVCLWNHCIFLL